MQDTRPAQAAQPQVPASPTGGSPAKFMLLTFLLSVPFVLVGASARGHLMPGLPVAALMFVCPGLAALLLVYRETGRTGVARLLTRCVDFKSVAPAYWYAPILLLMPAVALASFLVLRLAGVDLPAARPSIAWVLGLFVVFFVSGAAEELGWSGYALDPLQQRWGAVAAGLMLGVVWALWHLPALIQAGREVSWIAWWSLGTVAMRVLTVWLYNGAGRSILAAALFHATQNVTWQLFPVQGSHYDPRVHGMILTLVVLVVMVTREPRTLARKRAFRDAG